MHVAADLISQAEHDPLAAAVLVTDSVALADAVEVELERQVAATKHVERVRAALAGRQSGVVLVDDLDAGLRVVDAYAAEHLEIQTARRPERRRAGCATPARSSSAPSRPVSLGDYCAGSNHVLPDRRVRPALQRAVGAVVPARDPRRRLRRGGPARRRRRT